MSKIGPSAFFGLLALCVLFFKLPGVPELFGIDTCKSCSATTPYLPMLAASYFSALIVLILCFPTFPSRPVKYAGCLWALGLAVSLSYLSPSWCWICLGAHGCHLTMWMLWRPSTKKSRSPLGVRLSLVLTSAFAMMALFSTLNVTFLVYGLQFKKPMGSLVKRGSKVKSFALETLEKKAVSDALLSEYRGIVFNFVSPNCPYCKEQLPTLDTLAQDYHEQGFRFISISQKVVSDLQKLGPHLEWAEDESLAEQLGIEGYPTLVLVNTKGIIVKTIAGITANLTKEVATALNEDR